MGRNIITDKCMFRKQLLIIAINGQGNLGNFTYVGLSIAYIISEEYYLIDVKADRD